MTDELPRENVRAVRVLELLKEAVALKTHRDDGSSPQGASG